MCLYLRSCLSVVRLPKALLPLSTTLPIFEKFATVLAREICNQGSTMQGSLSFIGNAFTEHLHCFPPHVLPHHLFVIT